MPGIGCHSCRGPVRVAVWSGTNVCESLGTRTYPLAAGGWGEARPGLLGALLPGGMLAGAAAVLGFFLHGLAAEGWRARFGDAGLLAGEVAGEFPAARLSLQTF